MYKHIDTAQENLENYLVTIPNKQSKLFYQTRIKKFFNEYMSQKHNILRPLNTINFHDLNTYIDQLESSDAEKLNYFRAFNGFFRYMYLSDNLQSDVMKGVNKPVLQSKLLDYISRVELIQIQSFIKDSNEKIEDRLLLGLLLYTGLSRKYVANLTHYQFSFGNEYVSLFFEFGESTINIPLKSTVVNLVRVYFNSQQTINPFEKIFKIDENYVSEKVKILNKKITGKPLTPTVYSNSFIKEALRQGNDVLTVSQLTLESVHTIMKHVDAEEYRIRKQQHILENIFEDDDKIT
ncbi:hypothetical protein MKY98_17795 [Paenibacillus sp. FSL M8-0228]|uniref:hypothetical protein n=1 Tax=Paenibacillus TaxID=44249 RepID=UPI00083DFF26|nr:hypothetical protein [Paenibacillus polymyxa]MBO3286220.1 hypothetical protein [Paenibacillus polymyxa]ODB58091.1 hypothetical protein A7311_13165 [Paenibacillus polymyxa]